MLIGDIIRFSASDSPSTINLKISKLNWLEDVDRDFSNWVNSIGTGSPGRSSVVCFSHAELGIRRNISVSNRRIYYLFMILEI